MICARKDDLNDVDCVSTKLRSNEKIGKFCIHEPRFAATTK